MSDELHAEETQDEEFEEISSEEVDRVIASLEQLIDGVESENIRTQLETASNSIFYLVYDESDLEDDEEEELLDDGITAEAA